MKAERTYSLHEVISGEFEARCVAKGGTLYFWHRNYGVRINRRTGKATLLTDPALLPDAPWTATSLGMAELEALTAHEHQAADTAA
jgi:hypothetical protein